MSELDIEQYYRDCGVMEARIEEIRRYRVEEASEPEEVVEEPQEAAVEAEKVAPEEPAKKKAPAAKKAQDEKTAKTEDKPVEE